MKPELPIDGGEYLATCKRRFGRENPERMNNPVWEWMVREANNPYGARKSLGLELNCERPGNPDWCFERIGAQRVTMPDGRIITICGEYEDSYDPEFCIYNDVVVQQGDEVQIYGYPRSIFPPTDFHTATRVNDHIVIIGSLGYVEERQIGYTPVFRLDTSDYRINDVATHGDFPGWIHRHRAVYLEDENAIELTGGELTLFRDDTQYFKDNMDTFRLFLDDGAWHKITDNSDWRQFSIKYDQMIALDSNDLGWYTGKVLEPLGYPCKLYDEDNAIHDDEYASRAHTLFVDDVAVRCEDRHDEIRVTIQGTLPQSDVERLMVNLKEATQTTKLTVTAIEEL